MAPQRGEVWQADLGLAAKVRPVLVLSGPFGDQDYALITVIPHTTNPRGAAFEIALSVIGLLHQTGYEWVLVADVLVFWLICYGTVALVRLRPAPQWAFFAMTLFLVFQSLSQPAVNSPG